MDINDLYNNRYEREMSPQNHRIIDPVSRSIAIPESLKIAE